MKKLFFCSLSMAVLFFLSLELNAMNKTEKTISSSPPCWTFYARLVATIGRDTFGVKISLMEKVKEGEYLIPIRVLSANVKKAQSLATLLAKTHNLPGALVKVIVFDRSGRLIKPEPFPENVLAARMLFAQALSGNPYFIKMQDGNPYYNFFIEFTKEIVQFPDDMMDDFYCNENEVAAKSFLNVFALPKSSQLSIGTSTAR